MSLYKTIYPILIGGLGNRLYQIANAFRLRDKYGFNLKLYSIDPLPTNFDDYRTLGVKRPEDFADFGGHKLIKKEGLPQTINELFPKLSFETIGFDNLSYERLCCEKDKIDPTFDTAVVGYFFGYSNIKDYIQELRDCFNPIIDEHIKVPPKTLGIHLRLGIETDNYACNRVSLHFYDIVNSEVDYSRVYVFTDNPIKAKGLLLKTRFENVKIIENNPMYLDMLMLSQCDTMVISTSTLSAWSAYFSKGKVFVPKIWLKQHLSRYFSGICDNFTDICDRWIIR